MSLILSWLATKTSAIVNISDYRLSAQPYSQYFTIQEKNDLSQFLEWISQKHFHTPKLSVWTSVMNHLQLAQLSVAADKHRTSNVVQLRNKWLTWASSLN